MKNKTMFTSLACCFLMSTIFFSCTQEPVDSTSEFIEINKAFSDTYNQGAEAMANLYTSNATIYPPNAEAFSGTEAIKGMWQNLKGMGIQKAIFETIKAETMGSTTIDIGTYKLYVEGDFLVDQGKYIVTWKKENGEWKINNDIFNSSNPAPNPQAAVNDTIWIVNHYVFADKTALFEDFNAKYLGPAGKELRPDLMAKTRFMKPVKQNKDGTYTYVYMMDPFVSSVDYGIYPILETKFGEEEAKKIMKIFKECVKSSHYYKTIQLGW